MRVLQEPEARRWAYYCLWIVIGAGCFGAAMGSWRSPLQALFTAVKLPLIVLLTTVGNGLLNAMLAPLLGASLTFRQSLLAVFMSFTMAAAILGAFSPLLAFLVWNTPPHTTGGGTAFTGHSLILVTQAAVIALAGIAANVRLLQVLRGFCGDKSAASRVLLSWLGGNLLLGSQLSWILRPFVGSPHLPVEFLRADPMQGNFFESIFRAVTRLLFP